jgi:molybdopterin converting factor subunit 1
VCVTIGPLFFSGADFAPVDSVMTVTVLLFASYAEALGATSLELDVATNATVDDVLASLRRLPGADRLPPAPLVAVNERYAKRDHALAPGDEVAVIPPVAGG